MPNIRWTGQSLKDLFRLSAKEVSARYGVSSDYVYTKRKKIKRHVRQTIEAMETNNYHPQDYELERVEAVAEEDERIMQLLNDFKEAGLPVEPQDAGKVERITYWTQHSVDRETGEPVQVINRYVRMKPEGEADEAEKQIWPQATPADIRPTRRKPRADKEKRILVFSDPQIGFRRIIDGRTGQETMVALHDEASIDLMHQIAAHMQPNEIWNAGDTIDLPELSRFDSDSDHHHKTMGASFQAVHDLYAQLRADNPNAKIVEVSSNHNERLKKAILKFFPQAYDMYRPGDDSKYPMLSYPYMANLEVLEIEYIGGYGAAQYEYGQDYYEEINGRTYPRPPIQMRHGHETSSNGTTASKIHKNRPDVISVQGHSHNAELYLRANRLGQIIGAVVVPPLCKTTGEVPSYHSAIDDQNAVVPTQETWTNGVLEIVDNDGDYQFNVINFYRGVAHYRGKRFEATQLRDNM